MSITNATATRTLITGASAGIGVELARECARNGQSLVLVARRKERLEEIAAELRDRHRVTIDTIDQDLAESGSAQRLAERVQGLDVSIENLINNAGFGANGVFHDLEIDEQVRMIHLNCATLTELTHRFLPGMLSRRRGRILNVASTAAFQPGPFMAVYYATKAYVLSFTEAIAEETRGTGVSVTALCPGATRTEFQERANAENMQLLRFGTASARSVAAYGFRAMMSGKVIAIPGLSNKLLRQSIRITPHGVVRRVVRFINGKR